MVSELSFLLSNSKLKVYPDQTSDTAGQFVIKKHMGYRDDRRALVRNKQLASLDRGLEKQQLYSKSLLSVSFGCSMLRLYFLHHF